MRPGRPFQVESRSDVLGENNANISYKPEQQKTPPMACTLMETSSLAVKAVTSNPCVSVIINVKVFDCTAVNPTRKY